MGEVLHDVPRFLARALLAIHGNQEPLGLLPEYSW